MTQIKVGVVGAGGRIGRSVCAAVAPTTTWSSWQRSVGMLMAKLEVALP